MSCLSGRWGDGFPMGSHLLVGVVVSGGCDL